MASEPVRLKCTGTYEMKALPSATLPPPQASLAGRPTLPQPSVKKGPADTYILYLHRPLYGLQVRQSPAPLTWPSQPSSRPLYDLEGEALPPALLGEARHRQLQVDVQLRQGLQVACVADGADIPGGGWRGEE